MSKMIYTPFNSNISEKLEIVSFNIIHNKKEKNYILLYKLKKELDNGDIVTYYKASKFFRLIHVSKKTKENKQFLEIQADIIRGLYASNVHFVQLIANILELEGETPPGLIYLYGVQAIGATQEEAIKQCDRNYSALLRAFQGTHRTSHIQNPTLQEIEWIFKKLREQTHVTVVKGIPSPRRSTSQVKSIIPKETSSEEQMEEFLSAMITDEFLYLLMATPIEQKVLRHWLAKSLKEQTKWESQKQGSKNLSFGISVPMSLSMNTGQSEGTSLSRGESAGRSIGSSWGTSESHSEGQSFGTSHSTNVGESEGTNQGFSRGSSHGINEGSSESQSSGWSSGTGISGNVSGIKLGFFDVSGGINKNWGTSGGESVGVNRGESWGTSEGESFGSSKGTSRGESWGTNESFNESTTRGISEGGSESQNVGTSSGIGKNIGISRGFGSSMGIAPSLSVGKSYQFLDVTVQYICELLSVQNQRLKDSTEGEGAFFVDLYISCKNEEVQKGIQSLITSTWVNPDSKIDVLRGIIPDPKEQKKLSLHMQALSPCMEMEINRVGKFYKYASVLRSSELSAYSHPPRITTGGLDSSMDERPKFRVPNDRQDKAIFVGNLINGERYNIQQAMKHNGNGYMTDFKFGIGHDELHHAFISGQAGSGKSVLAWRLVSGLYNNTYTIDRLTGEKKRKRILVLDPKGEWRLLGNIIPKGKFKFFSLSDPHFHPVRMNILRVPKYIRAYDYYNMVVEMFCSAYGLLDRALAQIGSVIYDLYEQAGAFENDLDPNFANERTKNITMEDVYDSIEKLREVAISKRDNHNAEALQTYLTRLDAFKKKKSKEYIMFCNKGGDSIDSLLGDDEVTVIESNGLSRQAQGFFFTLTMASIFKYAQGVKGFYTKDQYETFIILEEANTVLIGGGKHDEASNMGIKRFEELIDQSRSFGLFIWTITQKIASMPDSVIANSGLIFSGKSARDDDIRIVLKAVGLDERFDESGRGMMKFFPKMPVGEFLVKVSKAKLEIDQEPVMVKVAPLNLEIPTDEELDLIINEHSIEKIRNSAN